jgi:hypothetical protein
MRLADDVGAEDLAEQVELRVACRVLATSDVEDRAVVLAQPDRAVRIDLGVRQVPELVLDDGQLAHSLDERSRGPDPIVELPTHAVADLPSARLEDLLDQRVAADRADRGEQSRRKPVVVRRKQLLGVGGDVVEVAWPADPVADRLLAHEVGVLERAELLEDAGPAGPDRCRELVRGRRPVAPEVLEDLASEGPGRGRDRRGGGRRLGSGSGLIGGRVHRPKASTGRRQARCAS